MRNRYITRTSSAVALCLAFIGTGAASEPSPTTAPSRMELTRCMSHVERASQAAMMRQPWAEDAAKAMRCHPDRYEHLPADQRGHLDTIYALFLLQTETPSVTVHTELLLEVQRFMQGMR